MESLNWTAVITDAYWPILVLFVAAILRKPISDVLRKRKLRLTLPNDVSFSIATDVAEKTLTNLFTEFYFTYNRLLKPSHKKLFETILLSETKLYVDELIPGFDRNNKEHIGALRALRGLGLIEPKHGGSWQNKSVIEITSFGKIFVEHLRMKEKSA